MKASTAVRAIRDTRLVAILRGSSTDRLVAAAGLLVEEGVRVLEFPLTGPGAPDALRRTVEAAGGSVVAGAGTVRTVDDARRALEAGAHFLVAPSLSVPVIEYARAHDTAVLPGAFTPTEIATALEAGAGLVKLFPAASHRPEFLRRLRVPLPEAGVVPTGGVGLDDAAAWLAAGAVAVGIGSPLTGDTLETGDLARLRVRARAWKAAVS
ncbi:bifunctional 4-hydroxy-2-oxoglutarate aldolase/2-dehydro-3-deoxy-phosphogluconate aldolase [Streptomyces sp. NPDC057616]|uniref:bifunctional 4-hydroxy-2-oxoglutarate aldolase/2-dehydro-3-deoxy-phosphogluconate aldolase n=1 Tax=Streptomyces sp. NPDC057616 TaxID=3346183 RepID=UPI0036B939B3